MNATDQPRDLYGKADTSVVKRSPVKIALVCNECGKHWKVGASNLDPQCPKCNGVDYEVL